jgi:hypothetical protein
MIKEANAKTWLSRETQAHLPWANLYGRKHIEEGVEGRDTETETQSERQTEHTHTERQRDRDREAESTKGPEAPEDAGSYMGHSLKCRRTSL